MSSVRLEQVCQRYIDAPHLAVNNVGFELASGEFLTVTGVDGSGKSSLLRSIAGLEEIESGRILIGNVDITHAPPKQRDIAMVFENYALYPHMNVGDNIGFPLRVVGMPKPEREARVSHIAELLGLAEILDRKPQALTGGQRQRVAIGRALAQRPHVLLMDEPFNNLPPHPRHETLARIRDITTAYEITTIYATNSAHDLSGEGNRVAVLNKGVLEQLDMPAVITASPSSVYIASHFGVPPRSIVRAERQADGAVTFAGIQLDTLPIESTEREVLVGLRPGAVNVSSGTGIPATITRGLPQPGYVNCTVTTSFGTETVTALSNVPTADGQACTLEFTSETVPCFSKKTGKALN